MKKKDRLDKYVERRLEEWAEWYQKGCGNGLGYPRRNILARLKDEGGVIINSTGAKLHMVNTDAEEIETLLGKLFKQRPKHVEVIRIYYLNPYEHESIAIDKGYTRSGYFAYLRLAHEWIKGYLSVKNNFKFF